MGVSVSAHLVVGVRLSDLVQMVREESVVTKFDQDTGKPYDRTVEIKKVKIGSTIHEQLADYPEDLIKWPKGLALVKTGDIGRRNNFDNVVVGVEVVEADDEDPVQHVDEEDLRQAREKAKKFLKKVGWDDEVSLYLVQYGSA